MRCVSPVCRYPITLSPPSLAFPLACLLKTLPSPLPMPNDLRPPIVARTCSLTRSLACTHSAFPVTAVFHTIFGVSFTQREDPMETCSHTRTDNKETCSPDFSYNTRAQGQTHKPQHICTKTRTHTHKHIRAHTHTTRIHTRLRKAIATRVNSCSDHLCSATLRHTPPYTNLKLPSHSPRTCSSFY